MERYTMFLNWKNQHCENEYTTQNNLQIHEAQQMPNRINLKKVHTQLYQNKTAKN